MRTLLLAAITAAMPFVAQAKCGGDFGAFVAGLETEAHAKGHSPQQVARFFDGVRQDPNVLRADRRQSLFKKTFTEFARSLISRSRLEEGRANARTHARTFRRAEAEYGIPSGVLLAFWALETDYGSFQGDFNTRDALVTLAHDCRRPTLFRPQIFAAITLAAQGGFDPKRTTGAWAGEVGMVQMLPADVLEHGVDGDGNGRVELKTSPTDALLSGARMLRSFGWKAGQPWLQEVKVPAEMDWSQAGLHTDLPVARWQQMGVVPRSGRFAAQGAASLILPQGRKGPAFLTYPNFRVFFDWNQSFTYVTTAAYFATRLADAPVFDPRSPEPGLDDTQMRRLQTRLAARGHAVGMIDGILGAGTRTAIRAEQRRLGLPADAWPTVALLNRL